MSKRLNYSITSSSTSGIIANVYPTASGVGVFTSSPQAAFQVSGSSLIQDVTTGNINFTGNLYKNGQL